MIALFGGRTPLIVVVMLGTMLFAGAAVGATEAEAGGEPVDLSETLEGEMFTENGELKEQESEPVPGQLEVVEQSNDALRDLFPATPQLDQTMEQQLVIPMLQGSIWVADFGFQLGYSMASTLGVGVTRVLLNGSVVLLVGGVLVHTARQVRDAGRGVGA